MKKLIVAMLFLAFNAQAQNKTYKAAPGERVDYALLKANGLYQYPQFVEALVTLKNGTSGTIRMNYNRLLDEMQFINGKGDTLSLDQAKEVVSIVIAKDTFFYANGYVQLLNETGVRIAKKTILKIVNRQRIGGMGEVSDGSTMYATMYSKYGVKDLVATEVITFAEATSYYIGDRFNNFKTLSKKNLYDRYAKQQKDIQAYLDANPVNYLKEDDVLRLIVFLKTL